MGGGKIGRHVARARYLHHLRNGNKDPQGMTLHGLHPPASREISQAK